MNKFSPLIIWITCSKIRNSNNVSKLSTDDIIIV